MRTWGIDRALSRYLSPEFETVMNQEYNYMLYMTRTMNMLAGCVGGVLLHVRSAKERVDACRSLASLADA